MSAEPIAEWMPPVVEAQAGIVIFGFPGLVPDRVVVPLMSTAVLRFHFEPDVLGPVVERMKRRLLDLIEDELS